LRVEIIDQAGRPSSSGERFTPRAGREELLLSGFASKTKSSAPGAVVVQRDRIEFQPMVDKAIT
jgi:hypothetical protein